MSLGISCVQVQATSTLSSSHRYVNWPAFLIDCSPRSLSCCLHPLISVTHSFNCPFHSLHCLKLGERNHDHWYCKHFEFGVRWFLSFYMEMNVAVTVDLSGTCNSAWAASGRSLSIKPRLFVIKWFVYLPLVKQTAPETSTLVYAINWIFFWKIIVISFLFKKTSIFMVIMFSKKVTSPDIL